MCVYECVHLFVQNKKGGRWVSYSITLLPFPLTQFLSENFQSLAARKTHNPPAFAPYSARVTCVHQAMLIWLWLVDWLADFAWIM